MTEKENRSKFTQNCIDIFAGTVGGFAVTLVGHPFDTLKIRLQTQPSDKPIYTGLKDCFLKTIKWEGPKGLYKGMSSPLLGQMFFRAFMFLSYQQAKILLSFGNTRKLTTKDYFICGGMGWGIGTIAECPIDFCKTQLQIEIIKRKSIPEYVPAYNGIADLAGKIYSMNGIRGFYQGFAIQLCRNIPAGSCHMGTFEFVRRRKADQLGVSFVDLPLINVIIAGACGGIVFWLPFFPIDVIKSTIQADNPNKELKQFDGIKSAVKFLYADGGIKRFYRGLAPCMLRSMPANAALLLTSTYISEHL